MKLGFAFRLYWQNLRASRNLNILSVGIITFSFLILGLFMLAAHNLGVVADKWGEQIQVVIFLKNSAREGDIREVEADLKSRPEVKELRFVTREEALSKLRSMLGEKARVLKALKKIRCPPALKSSWSKNTGTWNSSRASRPSLTAIPKWNRSFTGRTG